MAPVATPAGSAPAANVKGSEGKATADTITKDSTCRLPGQTSSTVFQERLPPSASTYVLSAGSGEHLYVPSTNQIYRIQAGSEQTTGAFAIVETQGTLSEPVPPHKHKEAHDVFFCLRGALQVWADGESRILRPGDFASVPPGVIHSYAHLSPHTSHLGLIFPGGWEEFFRVLGDPIAGPMALFPSGDKAPFPGQRFGRLIAEGHDVIPQPNHVLVQAAPLDRDVELPTESSAFFLRGDAGPRYILNAQQCQPLCRAVNTGSRFSIATIEGSSILKPSSLPQIKFSAAFTFLKVLDGFIDLRVGDKLDRLQHAETALVAPGDAFEIGFAAPYARVVVFSGASGMTYLGGLEEVFIAAGQSVSNEIFIGGSEGRTVEVGMDIMQAAARKLDAQIL